MRYGDVARGTPLNSWLQASEAQFDQYPVLVGAVHHRCELLRNRRAADQLQARVNPRGGGFDSGTHLTLASCCPGGREQITIRKTHKQRPRSTPASSTVSAATSTSSLKPNGKTAHKPKPREPVKTIVKYVTKQIHIYPMHPILTVERLQNLDYHISVLTESIGRRPRVYPHGKGVRFVPESNDEYRTIQRYLAKIESAERIAWCSYTLAPGNSLKVNVKVREVEIVKITEDLDKLKLQSGTNAAVAKSKESPVKLSSKDPLPKDIKVSRKDCSPKDGNISMKDSLTEDAKSPTTTQVLKESKPVVPAPKDRRLPVAKKPRDITQNSSYKTTNRS
ncbi:unnamed protein product, partial [Iphiclides podalirius]